MSEELTEEAQEDLGLDLSPSPMREIKLGVWLGTSINRGIRSWTRALTRMLNY